MYFLRHLLVDAESSEPQTLIAFKVQSKSELLIFFGCASPIPVDNAVPIIIITRNKIILFIDSIS